MHSSTPLRQLTRPVPTTPATKIRKARITASLQQPRAGAAGPRRARRRASAKPRSSATSVTGIRHGRARWKRVIQDLVRRARTRRRQPAPDGREESSTRPPRGSGAAVVRCEPKARVPPWLARRWRRLAFGSNQTRAPAARARRQKSASKRYAAPTKFSSKPPSWSRELPADREVPAHYGLYFLFQSRVESKLAARGEGSAVCPG